MPQPFSIAYLDKKDSNEYNPKSTEQQSNQNRSSLELLVGHLPLIWSSKVQKPVTLS